MSYTAFEKMRTVNYERFGKDLGPVQPPLLNNLLFLPGQSSMPADCFKMFPFLTQVFLHRKSTLIEGAK